MNVVTEAHSGSVNIRGGHVDSSQRAPLPEDFGDQRLARSARVILSEPFNRQAGNVDGVRPLASLQLVHVLCVPEVGVPVVSGRKVVLCFGRTDL